MESQLDEIRRELAAAARATKRSLPVDAEPVDRTAAYELAIGALEHSEEVETALDVLSFLLSSELPPRPSPATTSTQASPSTSADPSSTCTPTVPFVPIATVLYATLASTNSVNIRAARATLQVAIRIEAATGGSAAYTYLKERVRVASWSNKRSIVILHALMEVSKVESFAVFAVGKRSTAQAVLQMLLDCMASSEEIAVVCGRIILEWIEKVWEEALEDRRFWCQALATVLKAGRGVNSVCTYFVTLLLKKHPATFGEILRDGGFLDITRQVSWSEEEMEGAAALLKVGNKLGLVSFVPVSPSDPSPLVELPADLIAVLSLHASNSLRVSALSLLVSSNSSTILIPYPSFALLRLFYTSNSGSEDLDFRQYFMSLSSALISRLRDSCARARREGDTKYLEAAKEFLVWWSTHSLDSLNPSKPYRSRITATKVLSLILHSLVDPRFSPSSLTNGALPVGRGQIASWPFTLDLVNASTTSTLLRLFLSTYGALRAGGLQMLEGFGDSLPGYGTDAEGTEKMRSLVGKAVGMIRSGREAESGAGAELLGLVWRKQGMGKEGTLLDLGAMGGWSEGAAKGERDGFSFVNDLMDLADIQLLAHEVDLGRAASTTPMHGTLSALHHLFTSVPPSYLSTLGTPASRRAIFVRALGIVEKVWDVTKVVLAAASPEGPEGAIDTEEARALTVERGEADVEIDADGTGGPMHKVVMSATWRAMKEAGILLETILRLPSELGAEVFDSIWPLEDVKRIGDLFAVWLAKIRHRGAFMAIHPSYTRAAAALLRCTDRVQVQNLPYVWLDVHTESIVSKKVSITRRSAGIPFTIVGLLTIVVTANRDEFNSAIVRLFEIAESTSKDILDESRVHAMNTLNQAFQDGKLNVVIAPFVERGYLIAISMFWSTNWICRNVAMIFYASLVSRSFGTNRTNLERDNAALILRLPIADYFSRYPLLQPVLLSQLSYSSKEHLNDLDTANLHSSLFSILMIFSFLQTHNSIPGAPENVADAFVPLVRACAKSRVWKIRDAAGNALTGLVAPDDVGRVCLDLWSGIEECGENEIHGRLVQSLRLLQSSATLNSADTEALSTRLSLLLAPLLSESHSYAVRQALLSHYLTTSLVATSPTLLSTLDSAFTASCSWSQSASHLPNAESFATMVFKVLLHLEGSTYIARGLQSNHVEVRREAVAWLQSHSVSSNQSVVGEALLKIVEDKSEAPECRIGAIGTLVERSGEWGMQLSGSRMAEVRRGTRCVPLREALLPLVARLADGDTVASEAALAEIDLASGLDQSIESRESAAEALRGLRAPAIVKSQQYARVLVRLLQDDDTSVREVASQVVQLHWSNGVRLTERRNVEVVVASAPPTVLAEWMDEFAHDLEVLINPTSLLFLIEKPNIFIDDTLTTELMDPSHQIGTAAEILDVKDRLTRALSGKSTGPLGMGGNDLVSKWCRRLGISEEEKEAMVAGH